MPWDPEGELQPAGGLAGGPKGAPVIRWTDADGQE